jgi:hypothetical protein
MCCDGALVPAYEAGYPDTPIIRPEASPQCADQGHNRTCARESEHRLEQWSVERRISSVRLVGLEGGSLDEGCE